MSDKPEVNDQETGQVVPPTPQLNPRAAAMDAIAKRVEAQFEEDNKEAAGIQQLDESGRPVEAAPAVEPEPTAEAAPEPEAGAATEEPTPSTLEPGGEEPSPALGPLNPDEEYEIEVAPGKTLKVKGAQIIEAGQRSLAKRDTADSYLNQASTLLEVAKTVAATPPAPQGPAQPPAQPSPQEPAELSDEELANAIQYGTKEEGAAAIKQLRSSGRAVTPEQVMGFMTQNLDRMVERRLAFREAAQFAQDEYGDLLAEPMIRNLWFAEENRRRAPRERGGEGNMKPYKELYVEIGEELRKQLNRPKPVRAKPEGESLQARREDKAKGPRSVPTVAGGRVPPANAEPREPTHKEVLDGMRRARHQPTEKIA